MKSLRFIDYECTKGNAKCINWDGLEWLRSSAMVPFDREHVTSSSPLIETTHLSCTGFKMLLVKSR